VKFKFDYEVSKVIDFLTFPRVYFTKDEEKESENDIFEQVIKKYYKSFIDKMNLQLEPYIEDIKKYYQKDIYSTYDYAHILNQAFPVYDYKNEDVYLDYLVSIDDLEFRHKIIKALLTIDEESDVDDDFDESNAMGFINDLKIDSSNKWNLLLMIQEPKKYLTKFIGLLQKLKPLFYEHYNESKEEIINVGKDLSKRLSVNTNETFKKITYDAISYDFGDQDICYFYVSSIFPYTLRFIDEKDCRIVWGKDMEASFKMLYQLNQDKISQRVKVFKALGDKTRYETLKLLASGMSSIKDIATELDVSSATISYHINEFLTSGIITLSKEKNKKSGYLVDYEKLEEVINDFRNDLNFPK